MLELDQKRKYLLGIISGNISGIVLVIIYWTIMFQVLVNISSPLHILWEIIFIELIRIGLFILMSVILYHKWFQQEALFLSDAYFLFGMFFNILIYGKIQDLFGYLYYSQITLEYQIILFYLKTRYLLIIFNTLPLFYLGIFVLFSIFTTFIRELPEYVAKRVRFFIFTGFFTGTTFIILILPTIELVILLYSIILTTTLLGIVVMFFIMYKYKRLSQAHGLIIGLGFLLAIILSFYTSQLRNEFVNDASLVSSLIFAELIDMFVYFMVFLGFLIKPGYAKLSK
ncbi:MAG: hypothetical protein ACTSU4_11330 [Promethearchaeota archaeon]